MYVDIIHHCGLLYICIYWNPYQPADQPLQIISNSDFLLNIVITKKFRQRKRFDPSDSLPVVVVETVRCEPARFKFCYLPVGVNKNSDLPCVLECEQGLQYQYISPLYDTRNSCCGPLYRNYNLTTVQRGIHIA